MTNLDQRADRIRQIAKALHGRALSRDGEMLVEIPAAVTGVFTTMMACIGRFAAQTGNQSVRLAPRHTSDAQGNIIISDRDMAPQPHSTFKVW